MSSLAWYWHRIRAMSAAELAGHGRRKVHQFTDRVRGARRFDGLEELPAGATFPQLPPPDHAPPSLRAALEKDTGDILAGHWIAFGHLQIQVEDPPRWHKDYLAGVDMATDKPALKLHHRLEGKADIKLIWEPSRWFSLVRLAQAAYILRDARAAAACLKWLQDWADTNRPFFGWNWTSALESGLRLIQFCWIDALLSGAEIGRERPQAGAPERPGAFPSEAALGRLRRQILLPHLWFTWRDRSFGSSANNHLLGELAGLILAIVRWPELKSWAAPLETLQRIWEREVLTQFAPDGGNREQALNYHFFSWEFCWQARLALRASGRVISEPVEERLREALDFFTSVQVRRDRWDYGDSDSAYVSPLFMDWGEAVTEWHQWSSGSPAVSSAISYWIGNPPARLTSPAVVEPISHWHVYPESGYALCRVNDWFLRWDLSPLGYLATAGHGHCDALHLSAWFREEAVLIDPGTGVYHSDRRLRDYLASWQAHNGPHPVGANFPERRGTFLWSAHHALPRWEKLGDQTLSAEVVLPSGVMKRTLTYLPVDNGWQIDDAFHATGPVLETEVFWQFAPAAMLRCAGSRQFRIGLTRSSLALNLDAAWKTIESSLTAGKPTVYPGAQRENLRGACAPAFRAIDAGPYVCLQGSVQDPQRLRTVLVPDRSSAD